MTPARPERHDGETDLYEKGLSYRAKPITLCRSPEKAARSRVRLALGVEPFSGTWNGSNWFEADVGWSL
jgi:hypothetical protein